MPRFNIIKEGVNQELLRSTDERVEKYLNQIFYEHEFAKTDGIYSFSFGSINVEIRVVPWHSADVLVQVFSYLAEEVNLTLEVAEELLRLNSNSPFGGFGFTFDGAVKYSYSLAGANLDFNEFLAAVQTVASIADDYDEKIKEGSLVQG
ncbi:MAG: YbjN domain-containing protein [Bacteroidota bacterium]